MSVINTNITALISQQNLNRSQSALQTSMERLSSGLRINSAKDDAAGQAIANRMTSQIAGLNQAQRNANDGISMSQTAEGALNQVNDNLQRIRELTVQASNGTNNQSDLESIQNEIGQRLAEINRISEETGFNGLKVLSEDQSLKIQVGANDGETITISLSQINVETLGLQGFNVDGSGKVANTAASADDLVLAGFTASGPADANGTTTYSKIDTTPNVAAAATDVFAALSDIDTVTYSGSSNGLNAPADGNTYTYNAASDSFSFDVTGADAVDVAAHIKPPAGSTTTATVTIGSDTTEVIIASNGAMTNTNGEDLYIDAEGNLTTTQVGTTVAATVDNLLSFMAAADVAADVGGSGIDNNVALSNATISSNGTTYKGTDGADVDVTGATISAEALMGEAAASGASTSTGYTIAAGGAVTDGGGAVYLDVDGALTNANQTSVTTTYYAHANGNVTSGTGQQVYKNADGDFTFEAETSGTRTENALSVLDEALSKVDTLRSDLGAIQNRFESAITNLATTATNLTSARSRIEDADYAKEVSNMTRAQILQQAGTSVLAQANQIPQNVLSLLR